MTVLRSIDLLILAAIAEIGGAYLVWLGVRERRVGDEAAVIYDASGVRGWGRPPVTGERVLTSILLSTSSTPPSSPLPSATWVGRSCSAGSRAARRRIDHYRGRHIADTGDGVLAIFDSPGRAVMCGGDLSEMVRARELRLRVGVHTGEVEWVGGNIRGQEVHVAARVMAEAAPGEVLVIETSRGPGAAQDDDGFQLVSDRDSLAFGWLGWSMPVPHPTG